MDKEYWKNYYEQHNAPLQPSSFAKYILEHYLRDKESLIELGCGNGRDSIFFARHNIDVTAIDQHEDETKILAPHEKLNSLTYYGKDFTKLGNIGYFNHIYSRFTLHSISETEENDVLSWAHAYLKDGGYLFIEARGKLNELYKLGSPVPNQPDAYVYENHYRRFIDINVLNKKLIDLGFTILLSEEKRGFAPFKETDYIFTRIIAKKNKK